MLKKIYHVIGVMSGTSLDGIDIIYAKFQLDDVWTFKILQYKTIPYSSKWHEKLNHLTQLSQEQLEKLDEEYTEHLANTIAEFIAEYSINVIDFVASHGHTALHQPEAGYTYQIGNLETLSNFLNLKVICDFRVQDVQLGGQGAPLVPIGDKGLFSNYEYCLNLGGFANISFDKNKKRIAFDICPVNIVLNNYVNHLGFPFDDKGNIARTGVLHRTLLKELNDLEFYEQNAPKSLGLEWVEEFIFPLINRFNLNAKDVLRTFVEHIANQISKVISKENSTLLITGGSAYNQFLIERIKSLNSRSHIIIPSKEIIEFKEALIFAFLGVLKDRDEVNCLSSVTGAKYDHSSGKIMHPKKNL